MRRQPSNSRKLAPRRAGPFPEFGCLANRTLQERIGHLLTRPVGRPRNEVRRSYANFIYQAGSWTKPRRVVAKLEWHPGELYLRVGFIVTNMARPADSGSRRARPRDWTRHRGKTILNAQGVL
jgi:hypothetical protein